MSRCFPSACIREHQDDTGRAHGQGKWLPFEDYLLQKSGAQVSHSCCPACLQKAMDDM